jgi:hypothetical protein
MIFLAVSNYKYLNPPTWGQCPPKPHRQRPLASYRNTMFLKIQEENLLGMTEVISNAIRE